MGKSSDTTSETTSEPPKWAKPLLTTGASAALKAFNTDQGFNSWTGDRVADLSQYTQDALKGINAKSNLLNQTGSDALKDASKIIDKNGVTGVNQQSMDYLKNVQQGQYDPTTKYFENLAESGGTNATIKNAAQGLNQVQNQATNDATLAPLKTIAGSGGTNTTLNQAKSEVGSLIDTAQGAGAAENYLTSTARGDYLEGSPFLQELLDRESAKITDQINSTMSGMGRYGSAGAHQGVLGQTLGDFRLNALNDNYARERQLMVDAAGTISGEEQGRLGLGLAGTDQLAGIGQDIYGNNLASAQALEDARQGRMGLATGASTALGDIGQNIQSNKLAEAEGLYGAEGGNLDRSVAAAESRSGISTTAQGQALEAMGLVPTLQSSAIAGDMAKLGAGQIKEQQKQAEIDAQMQKFNERDMADWNRIAALLSGGITSAGSYGTQTTTTSTPSSFNPLSIFGLFGSLLPTG